MVTWMYPCEALGCDKHGVNENVCGPDLCGLQGEPYLKYNADIINKGLLMLLNVINALRNPKFAMVIYIHFLLTDFEFESVFEWNMYPLRVYLRILG